MSLSLSNSSNVFNYNKLNRCNYYHWSESTMTALKAKGVWCIVTRTEAKPTYSAVIQKVIHTENTVLTAKQEVEKKGIDEKILEWDLRNNLALAIIVGGIEDMQKVHIQGKESAKVAWDKLKDVHQMLQLGMVKFHLREELRDLKYEEGSSMQVHIDQVVTTAQKLDELGRPVPDIEIAETLIMSLPKMPVWTVINVSLSSLNPLMSEAVKARLLIEGSREKPSDTSPPTTTTSTTTTTVECALPAVEDSRQNSGSRNGRGNGSTRGEIAALMDATLTLTQICMALLIETTTVANAATVQTIAAIIVKIVDTGSGIVTRRRGI
jgi:hypothetical protein